MSWFINLLQIFIFTYSSSLIGTYILGRLRLFDDSFTKIEYTAHSIALGYGAWGIFGLLAAAAEIFSQNTFLILIVLLFFLQRKKIVCHFCLFVSMLTDFKRHLTSLFHSLSLIYKILTFIVSVWFLIYCAISFLPYTMNPSDALYYHLPFALEVVFTKSILFPVAGDISYGHLPIFAELLFAVTIALFQNLLVFKILQFSIFTLLFIVILSFIKRFVCNRESLWLAAILLLANMPLIKTAVEGGLIDIFPTFFGISSILLLVDLITGAKKKEGGDVKTVLLAGIYLGFGSSVKYSALLFVTISLIFVLYWIGRNKIAGYRALKYIFFFLGPIFLISVFWYLKNLILTGNPVFPILSKNDGGFLHEVNSFVVNRTPVGFLLFPFLFFGKSGFFLPYAIFTSLIFILTYILMIWGWLRRTLSPLDVLLFFAAQLYLLQLFFFSHILRFAVPVLVIMTILFTVLLDKALLAVRKNYHLNFFSLLLAVVGLFLLVISLWGTSLRIQTRCLFGINSATFCYEKFTGKEIFPINYISGNIMDSKIIWYGNTFYRYSLMKGNNYSLLSCGGKNKESVEQCLNKERLFYLLDDEMVAERLGILMGRGNMTASSKLETIYFFRKYGRMIYEYQEPKSKKYLRVYTRI